MFIEFLTPTSRLYITFAPSNAIFLKFKWHLVLKTHTTFVIKMSNATSLSASIGVIYNSVFPPAHHEDHILRNKNDKIKHTSRKLPIEPTVYAHPLNETRSRSDYTDSFKSSVCGEVSESCMQETRLLVRSHVARLNRNKVCIHIYEIFKLTS